MIDLYTAATPNGWKISIALEELALPYNIKLINLMTGEQKEESYLKINPNGRIPTIVDRDNNDFAVFESGAILMYLAEKTKKLIPEDEKKRYEVIQWIMFQMSGIGPMMGQANVFYRYFPEKIPAVIERYQNESRRLFEVLDKRLEDREYICDEFSIADIATWPWVRTYKWSGVKIDGLYHLKDWLDLMSKRPACIKGIETPPFPKITSDQMAKGAQTILTK